MKIKHECITCITKQTTSLASKLTNDEEKQTSIISYGLDILSKNWQCTSSPIVSDVIKANMYFYIIKITKGVLLLKNVLSFN